MKVLDTNLSTEVIDEKTIDGYQQKLEEYAFVPGKKFPQTILFLMKPIQNRAFYPLEIQKKLHTLDEKLYSYLRESLNREDIKKDDKEKIFIQCLDNGLNVNWMVKNKTLIKIAIHNQFNQVVFKLLKDPEIDVYGPRGYHIYTTLVNITLNGKSIIEWFIDILHQLKNINFYPFHLMRLLLALLSTPDLKSKLSPEYSEKLLELFIKIIDPKVDGSLVFLNILQSKINQLKSIFSFDNENFKLLIFMLKDGNCDQKIEGISTSTSSLKQLAEQTHLWNYLLDFIDMRSLQNLLAVNKTINNSSTQAKLKRLIPFKHKTSEVKDDNPLKAHQKEEKNFVATLDVNSTINSWVFYGNEQETPLIGIAIEKGFIELAIHLLYEKEIIVQGFFADAILAGFKYFDHDAHPSEAETVLVFIWALDILLRLKQLFFSRIHLYLILTEFTVVELSSYEPFNDEKANHIFSILTYINEDNKNIHPKDIFNLITWEFIRNLSLKCSENIAVKFIEFQIELLRKQEFHLVTNDLIDLLIPSNTGYYYFNKKGNIIQAHIKLLRLAFKKSIDQEYFFKKLSLTKNVDNYNLAQYASYASPHSLNEFFGLISDTFQEKPREIFLQPIFIMLSNLNKHKSSCILNIATYGLKDQIITFIKLLQQLVAQGALAEKIFSLQFIKHSREFIFSHEIMHSGGKSEFIIYEFHNYLQEYATNSSRAHGVITLLSVQNKFLLCVGHYVCLTTEKNISEHFKLLSKLLKLGVSPASIYDYFLITDDTKRSVWQTLLRDSRAVCRLMVNMLQQLITITSENKTNTATNEEKLNEPVNNTLSMNANDCYPKLLNLLHEKDDNGISLFHHEVYQGTPEDLSTYFKILENLSNALSLTDLLNFLLLKDSSDNVCFLTVALQCEPDSQTRILEFLITIIKRPDADATIADKIFELMTSKNRNGFDYLIAISSNSNLVLKIFLQLVLLLQQKNPALSTQISSWLQYISNVFCDSGMLEKYSQMSNQDLLLLFPLKKVYPHNALRRKIASIISKYYIDDSTDVFENTLFTLAGMKQPVREVNFASRHYKFYPYTTTIQVSYSHSQTKTLIAKLNHQWPGIALTASESRADGRYEIFLDIEKIIHEVLDSEAFDTHLQNKIQTNPLLLLAYQMEVGIKTNINFNPDIISALKAFATDNVVYIPSEILSIIIGLKLSLPGQIRDVTKQEAEDATAVALLELQFPIDSTPPALEIIIQRINSYFGEFCARALAQNENIYFIAIAKQLLVSNAFQVLFQKSTFSSSTSATSMQRFFSARNTNSSSSSLEASETKQTTSADLSKQFPLLGN